MEMVARYRAADAKGRMHLVEEFVDQQRGHWLELTDGTEVTKTNTGSFDSVTGENFLLIGRD